MTTARGDVVAIWNPASGSAPDEADLREALGEEVRLVETTHDDPGPGQARDAVEQGARIVAACGGDGTVRACLAPLAGSDTALGIVPLGTGNLLAANLGIDAGLDAGASIGKGDPRTIDVGWVEGEAFAVMAGTGFDALMIRDAPDSLKSRIGTPAYVISGARNLRAEQVATTVTVDGEVWFDGDTSMVLIGNFGEISGGLTVFPDADPCDGRLDVAVLSASTLREWGSIAWNLLRGTDPRSRLARRTQGSDIVVEQASPRVWELDGEHREPTTRMEFFVQTRAIRIHHSTDRPPT